MEIRPEHREYFRQLRIISEDEADTIDCDALEKIKKALNRAHDLRKFEIELYWKRATYFWAFQAAAFVMLGVLLNEKDLPGFEGASLLLPTFFGAVTAIAAYLSASGSKFWYENWEEHVEMLSSYIEGRLLEVVWTDESGLIWSVTKVNKRLLGILSIVWSVGFFFIGFVKTFPSFDIVKLCEVDMNFGVGVVWMLGIFMLLSFKWRGESSLLTEVKQVKLKSSKVKSKAVARDKA